MMNELKRELELIAQVIHDINVDKGWRGIYAPARSFGDDIALLHSEVSEALEAYRDFGIAQVYRAANGEFAEAFFGVLRAGGVGFETVSPGELETVRVPRCASTIRGRGQPHTRWSTTRAPAASSPSPARPRPAG